MMNTLSESHPTTILVNKMIRISNEMKEKYKDQGPVKLIDDDEVMAVCWNAGIELDYDISSTADFNYRLIITTKEPVGAIWDGEKFVVYHKSQLK